MHLSHPKSPAPVFGWTEPLRPYVRVHKAARWEALRLLKATYANAWERQLALGLAAFYGWEAARSRLETTWSYMPHEMLIARAERARQKRRGEKSDASKRGFTLEELNARFRRRYPPPPPDPYARLRRVVARKRGKR